MANPLSSFTSSLSKKLTQKIDQAQKKLISLQRGATNLGEKAFSPKYAQQRGDFYKKTITDPIDKAISKMAVPTPGTQKNVFEQIKRDAPANIQRIFKPAAEYIRRESPLIGTEFSKEYKTGIKAFESVSKDGKVKWGDLTNSQKNTLMQEAKPLGERLGTIALGMSDPMRTKIDPKRVQFTQLKQAQTELAKIADMIDKKANEGFVRRHLDAIMDKITEIKGQEHLPSTLNKGGKYGAESALKEVYSALDDIQTQMKNLGFDPASGAPLETVKSIKNWSPPKAPNDVVFYSEPVAKNVGRLVQERNLSGSLSITGTDDAMRLAKQYLKIPDSELAKMMPDDILRELSDQLSKNQRTAYVEIPLKGMKTESSLGFQKGLVNSGDDVISTQATKGGGEIQIAKSPQQILQEIGSTKNGIQGKVLSQEELNVLGNYLKQSGDDAMRGTVYKPYGGGEDLVFGVIKDRQFKGSKEYLVMNNSGANKGMFRLHSTPISKSDIISSPTATKGGEEIPGFQKGFIDFGEIGQSVSQTAQKLKAKAKNLLGTQPEELPQGQNTSGQLKLASGEIIPADSPVAKITKLLKEAEPMREQQEKLYSLERAKRTGAVAGIGEQVAGEKGFYQKLGALKGELPKVEFSRIKNGLQQADIDELYNMVENKKTLTVYEKLNAQTGLNKLLGIQGGEVPTQGEIDIMTEVFPKEMIDAIMAKRPFMERLWEGAQSAINIPRSAMATADLSAPLRQGWMMLGRPKQFAKSLGTMFKSFASEKAYKAAMEEIQSRPTYLKMKDAGLSLTDLGSNLSKREETFMSNLVEKTPLFGRLARASNRAYTGFLNKLRADVFDDIIRGAEKQTGGVSDSVLQSTAKFVNNATGRGDLPKFLQKSAPILNATFFSPKLLASRMNTLNPMFYVNLDPFVRKEALKTLLGTTAIAGTTLGLSKLAGAEVGADPRSADFGKIKIGNTRYDVLGGYQQYIKLASQLYTGQIVSSTTGKTITLGEGYKPLTRKDILVRFFEGKESPLASFITDLATGQTGTGEPVHVPEEIISRFIPLVVQDTYDLYQEWGPKGIPMALPGFFGAGSQTYGKQEIVKGKNKIGQDVTAVRPVKDFPGVISEKVFGPKPVGVTSQYNMDAFLKQFSGMSPQEKTSAMNVIKGDSDLLKKFNESVEKVEKGITPDDETLKSKQVKNGDRATAIVKNLNRLKTPEEKKNLLKEYASKGIINDEVMDQIIFILNK